MSSVSRATLLQMAILAGMAGTAALISNTLPFPARRLAWSGARVALPSVPAAKGGPGPQDPTPPRATIQEPGRPGPTPSPAPDKPPPPTHRAAVPPPPADTAVVSPIREISSREAWEAFQAGVPFLDARRSADFSEGHIAGAWSTPVWEADLDDRLIAFKAARRPGSEDPIAIYCSGGECRDSHLLAAKLLNEGYFHLLIYRDGFPAWVAQGRPVEKGRP